MNRASKSRNSLLFAASIAGILAVGCGQQNGSQTQQTKVMELDKLPKVATYTAYRTASPLVIDGKLDESTWKQAPWSTPFVHLITGEPGFFPTRCAIVWDDQYLYVGFDVPETYIRARLKEHDADIWEDNDVEVFIAFKDTYLEYEVNALGTVLDIFWVWRDAWAPGRPWFGRPDLNPKSPRTFSMQGITMPYVHPRGWRYGFREWNIPGLRQGIALDGTLNKDDDVDRGWSVEVAFPWEALRQFEPDRTLPPNEGDQLRIDCSRFQHYYPTGEEILITDTGWAWNVHGYWDSHIPERFTVVTFTRRTTAEASRK